MTNKEAIAYLEDPFPLSNSLSIERRLELHDKALSMAIEALKAQDAKDAKSMPSGETIYRQDAMDAIFSEPLYESGMKKRDADEVVPAIYEKIKSLPSAQSEKRTEERTETHACDLISRQAAIDILDAYQVMIENGEENPYAWARLRMSELPSAQPKMVCVANVTLTEEQVQEAFEKAKRDILSAQPEIIRCKDCKHRPTLDEYGKPDFPTYRCPCRCDDFYYSWMPKDDWFCGNAERRTDER